MATTQSEQRRLTPALMRSLDILELFREHTELTGAEVTRLTGHPRASVHELLTTLAHRGYLRRQEPGGVYHLGVAAFLLGNAYADSLDLRGIGDRIARELCAEVGETINVGVLQGSQVVYLAKVDSTRPVRLVSSRGGTLPAHCTSVGKALLAYLPKDELERIIAGGLPRMTSHSITSGPRLREELIKVRQQGHSYESGESTPGVTCVAAPVRGHDGEVVASLSVSVPDLRWPERSREKWIEVVRSGAARLSHELGHDGPS